MAFPPIGPRSPPPLPINRARARFLRSSARRCVHRVRGVVCEWVRVRGVMCELWVHFIIMDPPLLCASRVDQSLGLAIIGIGPALCELYSSWYGFGGQFLCTASSRLAWSWQQCGCRVEALGLVPFGIWELKLIAVAAVCCVAPGEAIPGTRLCRGLQQCQL